MARVLITGSTDGLGRAAARKLIEEGHQVILHARSHERVSVLDDLVSRSGGVVVGDLRSAAETRRLAEQVNAMGRMDAVIHNAGISSTKDRSPTPEGHASILAVNTLKAAAPDGRCGDDIVTSCVGTTSRAPQATQAQCP